ncbi:MAG: hypothetical protein ABSB15_27440 [Bryobacteraceae bacterium]|jgi:hypothetical protein
MTADTIAEISLAEAAPCRLEDEVVSLFEQLRTPVLRYVLSFHIPLADAEESCRRSFRGSSGTCGKANRA